MAVQFKVRLSPSLTKMIFGGWVVNFGGAAKGEVNNESVNWRFCSKLSTVSTGSSCIAALM